MIGAREVSEWDTRDFSNIIFIRLFAGGVWLANSCNSS
jgi:hypothetical protein